MDRWLYIPRVASAHGAQIDHVNDLVHWLMLVLFVGWSAFFLYALFRFRRGRNPKASYTGARGHTSTYLEIAVAIVEAVLLIGFSIPLWADRVDEFPAESEAVVVRVVGEQFAWNVHYPGPDGLFGKTDVAKIDLASNPLGLDREDPAAKDDFTTVNQLHLPVHKPAIIHLSSKDVIHSFNQPHMRVKQDAVPGMSIPLWFEPIVTTAEMRKILGNENFVYEIACAQLCGLGHYTMRGFLTVETQDEFDLWLASQTPAPTEGEAGFWE